MFSKLTGSSRPGPASVQKEDDASLDKVLPSPEDKLEFVLLIMLCTDRMRENLDAVFDPSITSSPAPPPAPTSLWQDPKDAPTDKPPTYTQATKELGQDDYIRRKRELSSPQMKELRRDAIFSFAKWRLKVLKRAGEVFKVSATAANAAKARRVELGLPISTSAADQGGDLIDLDDKADAAKSTNRYSKVPTSLKELDEPNRVLLLNSLLLLLLSLERYSAYSRSTLR